MISQAQKIDCRAFVGEIYFRFFRNRLIQKNQISRLTPDTNKVLSQFPKSEKKQENPDIKYLPTKLAVDRDLELWHLMP